ncbi:organic solute transporter Ostalpha-domain-containing protein [Phycomyces blakesleeanus]|uniref:Uncharacterized protein n=2 Tax=Phycomyces blakesleeanus TaxID=4837 RepID=A0A167NVZ6_PHYB8|nr:hypothetical protein PHYBLDRAFT_77250 [Phycomyces blakesleeanus NRRL 1555(-)]OAD76719.1 hypothetical protein PHYBLDRAFT_77250 [Phycomyces blakesleeanus NRRL 1555(-)]|eukprot:XP_018294759.1 hypothetical protein PHYBLDRAFT_77250 [Phycomyces blakesleeanus NRRL 1555(-)]
MEANSTAEESCPNTGGLRIDGGLDTPGFHFVDAWNHPQQNWHVIGWVVCALLLLITWTTAFVVISRHLKNYYDPNIQRHKLRVLLYPPFYATLAWLSYLRYDYATTITFFATLFESFAVFNLYACLQAYLKPFRDEAGGAKIPLTTKVFSLFTVNLKSKFGLHYRVITDILVFQYPLWAIIDAFVSIFTSIKGFYCGSSYNFHGAHVYLVIINFTSLSIILSALFTYLAVFEAEWKKGQISAHGMFWCVKAPIMIIFYGGDILLTGLTTAGVIHGTTGETSSDGIAWPAAAVKNGIYVIIVCVVMCAVTFMMVKYFGPRDNLTNQLEKDVRPLGVWVAIVDAYLGYIPEFLYNVFGCGKDSYQLVRKRVELRSRKQREKLVAGDPGANLLQPDGRHDEEYSMSQQHAPSYNTGYNNTSIPEPSHQYQPPPKGRESNYRQV